MTARPIFAFVLFAAFLIYCLSTNFAVAASSQKFYCSVQADIAEAMERDFLATDIKPEHFQNDTRNFLARRVARCMERGEEVRACVLRQCMERTISVTASVVPVGSAGLSARARACYEKHGDEYVIASARLGGMTLEKIKEEARLAPNMDVQRRARIKNTITEVYLLRFNEVLSWWDNIFRICMKEGAGESVSRIDTDLNMVVQWQERWEKKQAELDKLAAPAEPPKSPEIQQLTQEQANVIYAIAYGQCPKLKGMKGGCPRAWFEDRAPDLYVVSVVFMCGWRHVAPNCSIKGMYDPNKVSVSDEIDYYAPWGISIMLHEFLHHFQYLRDGREPSGCEELKNTEHEVYEIQAKYLDSAGATMAMRSVLNTAAQIMSWACSAESGS